MEFKVGDKVRYIGNDHKSEPDYYPEKMTLGTIKTIGNGDCLVQWEIGSTSGSDQWYSDNCDLLRGIREDIKFKPENLKTGHIVTFRNGFKARVFTNVEGFTDLAVNHKLTISVPIDEYAINFSHLTKEEYDIMLVEKTMYIDDLNGDVNDIKDSTTIWTRPVSRKLSRADIQKAFGCTDFVIEED